MSMGNFACKHLFCMSEKKNERENCASGGKTDVFLFLFVLVTYDENVDRQISFRMYSLNFSCTE